MFFESCCSKGEWEFSKTGGCRCYLDSKMPLTQVPQTECLVFPLVSMEPSLGLATRTTIVSLKSMTTFDMRKQHDGDDAY